MHDKRVVVTQGLSTSSLLGVVFIILKLTNVIGWSWWWVLSPFWIPWAIAILIAIPIVIIAVIVSCMAGE
jgi:hypothetical protein